MQKMGRWDSGDTQYTARLDRDVKPDNATFKLVITPPPRQYTRDVDQGAPVSLTVDAPV